MCLLSNLRSLAIEAITLELQDLSCPVYSARLDEELTMTGV